MSPEDQAHATLEVLKRRYKDCNACVLHTGRTNMVFGRGPVPAPLVIIGEGPGEQEDHCGEPFRGKAGDILEKGAREAGLDLSKVYITNLVLCRPPSNRVPMYDELDKCRARLQLQLKCLAPRALLLLGGTACLSLLALNGITKHRGKWKEYSFKWKTMECSFPAISTFHPAGLIPGRIRKPEDWDDFVKDIAAAKEKAGL